MTRQVAALLAGGASLFLAAPSAWSCQFHEGGLYSRVYGGMASSRGAFGIYAPQGTADELAPQPQQPQYTIDDARTQFLARYKVKVEASAPAKSSDKF